MVTNLVPLSKRTKDEQRQICQKGGKASGAKRRQQKTMRELLALALQMPAEDGNSNAEAICAALVDRAKAGDVRAAEFIRDTVGEKPTTTLDHTSTDGSLAPEIRIDLSGQSIENLMRLTHEAWSNQDCA